MKKKITVEFEYEHEMSEVAMSDYIKRSFRPMVNITISNWKSGGINNSSTKNPLSVPFFTREEPLTIVGMVKEALQNVFGIATTGFEKFKEKIGESKI